MTAAHLQPSFWALDPAAQVELLRDSLLAGTLSLDDLVLHVEPIVRQHAATPAETADSARLVSAIERLAVTELEPERTRLIADQLTAALALLPPRSQTAPGRELAKDESILQLLADLAPDTRGWCLVDHWEADRVAIGLASPRRPRRLVYVSAWLQEPGRWYYECEVPTGPAPTDYTVVARGDGADLATLLRVLADHLDAP